MLRAKKISKRTWVSLISVVVLLVIVGTVFASDIDTKIASRFRIWFGLSQPSNPVPVPVPEPEPGPEPKPEPQPEPQTPVIYVGQKLVIPMSGSDTPDKSQIIRSGMVSGEQKQMALTFDAGWLYDQTGALLQVLETYNVQSTFFMRALWVQDHPELTKDIVSKGHIIENHSLTHGHLITMSNQEITNEMKQSTQIIRNATGRTPYLFRPPFGEYNDILLRIAAQEGYPYTVMWTVDTHDWAQEIRGVEVTTDYVVNRVLDNATNNGIVLMHVGGFKTIEALPRIIEGLRERGYNLVTVNEMLPTLQQDNIVHTVQKGDTLYALGLRYGVSVQQIIDANGL